MGKALASPSHRRFRVSRRLKSMSKAKKEFCKDKLAAYQPALTPYGTRKSALNGPISDKIKDVALPPPRKLIITKKMYRTTFSKERLTKLDRLIELSNMTPYAKLAKAKLDLKKSNELTTKKKRGWTDSDWAKHMPTINTLAKPKDDFESEPWDRGPSKPLAEFYPRLDELATCPPFRIYKSPSKDNWYKDPIKVPESALKYVITERVKKLATPKIYAPID